MNIFSNLIFNKRVLITGLALFAMFFGAGNILFPLYIGCHVGEHIVEASIGFILSGVGVPFLALIATSQYQGDYWKFFNNLGRIPAFILVSLLMIAIGPLSAMPRTAIITFNSLIPYLPDTFNNQYIFGIGYFAVVFLFSYRESKIIDIIGSIFSPIKIILFIILTGFGIYFSEPAMLSDMSSYKAFSEAVIYGYGTMDMFGAFFFCTIAFNSLKGQITPSSSQEDRVKIIISSSIVGAIVLGSVYLGFLYLGYSHASSLRDLPEEALIAAISQKILGRFGGTFVCIAVSFACLSTAIALARVCTFFLYSDVCRTKISSNICLFLIIFGSYCTSILGFQTLLKILFPILEIIYPGLIIYSVVSILCKWKHFHTIHAIVVFTAQLITVKTFFAWVTKLIFIKFKFLTKKVF